MLQQTTLSLLVFMPPLLKFISTLWHKIYVLKVACRRCLSIFVLTSFTNAVFWFIEYSSENDFQYEKFFMKM